MEKTKEQVVKYLSRRRYSEEQWSAILAFCLKKYGSGARRAIRPSVESSISDFMEWLGNGIGDGDVVRDIDGRIGIFVDYGNVQKLAVYLYEGRLVKEPFVCGEVRPVDEETAENLYGRMTEEGVVFSLNLSRIHEAEIPIQCQRKRFAWKGQTYVGIVKSIVGRRVDFLFVIFDKKMQTDFSCDLWDIQWKTEGRLDARLINSILEDNGLAVDMGTCSLVKMDKRQSRGGRYWYITDKLTITRVEDTGSATHNARYECHNYFSSYSSAENVRQLLERIAEKHERGERH